MPKKSRKNLELNATENPESAPIENPEPRETENPEPKAAEKPAPKVRKRAARKMPAVADSVPADTPGSEQAELEFNAGSAASSLDQVADARALAESEAKAAAADTFEQAYEERLPSEASDLLDIVLDAPARELSEIETAAAKDNATRLIGDLAQAIEEEPESGAAERPPAKLERLQKILSRAGIASRRHAEEMIAEGRVQVNGKVITELGSKADAASDHIRVDGKLLQGAERFRYFMFNKPRGYVTTVSDPEGRPTVMQFFSKMSERLYPVGRLDYLSEGLLLVTNDGDLANKLTRAATGVQKTYLVKVSGQPSQEELDLLREGVAIDRTRPGEGRVQTAPASIRQVRHGDNPWYEVVLIEGRNRELRKMFEEIGHFVEKIRRVGYGPLVLDQEPGQFRELGPEELVRLRQAAEGKWRRPKAKSVGHRDGADVGGLPTVTPKPSRPRPAFEGRVPGAAGSRPYASKRPFGPPEDQQQPRPFRSTRSSGSPARGRAGAAEGPAKFGTGRPAWKKEDRGARPASFRSGGGGRDRGAGYRGGQDTSASAPGTRGSSEDRSAAGRTGAARPFGARRTWENREGGDRPRFDKRGSRPGFESPRSTTSRPGQVRPPDSQGERPRFERTGGTRPPQSYGRTGLRSSSTSRPPRGEGGARPFTTSTGKPRAGAPRPGARPGKTSTRPYSGSKPDGRSGPRPPGKSRNYGGAAKPASGPGKRPQSNDRGTAARSGPRPGPNRSGGKSGKRH